jgi:hypothetical protein
MKKSLCQFVALDGKEATLIPHFLKSFGVGWGGVGWGGVG